MHSFGPAVVLAAFILAARPPTPPPQPTPPAKLSTHNLAPVPWSELLREIRKAQQPTRALPASALSLLLTTTELLAPKLRGECFDAVINGVALRSLSRKIRLVGLLVLTRWVLHILTGTLFAAARWKSTQTGRIRLMEAIQKQEAAFFDATPPTSLASRLITEPDRLQEVANRGPERALNALLALAGGLALMLRTDWRLALVAILVRAPLVSPLSTAAGRAVGRISAAQQVAIEASNSYASEALHHARAVLALDAGPQILRDYGERVNHHTRVVRHHLLAETALRYVALLIDSVSSYALFGGGLIALANGRISLGALTAFYAYAETFERGCKGAVELLQSLNELQTSSRYYFHLLAMKPRMRSGRLIPSACAGELRLINASFAYPGGEAILRGVDLHVRPGETLAITGPSGSGKSTLLLLLLRLYDPTRGCVRLDEHALQALDLKWLRAQVGYVPQDPALFDMSIEENVALGLDPADPNIVAGALKDAGAEGFALSLNATKLGQSGRSLSRGQQQRVGIARALAREPRVLLLDEHSASLDGETERHVRETLSARRGKSTTVLVSHRLATLAAADRVAVICNGSLAELGTPGELSQAGGWFQMSFFPQG